VDIADILNFSRILASHLSHIFTCRTCF